MDRCGICIWYSQSRRTCDGHTVDSGSWCPSFSLRGKPQGNQETETKDLGTSHDETPHGHG